MQTELLVPVLVVFSSIALAVGAVTSFLLRRTTTVERRLRYFGQPTTETSVVGGLDRTKTTYGSLDTVAPILPKSPKEMSALRRRLVIAGFDRPEAAAVFALAEVLLPILFGGAALLYLGSGSTGILAALFVAALAYIAPGLWLGQRMAARRKQIQNGLPDALDLLLITVESGSGLDQAFIKAGQELELSYPLLAREFQNVVTEIRAGRPRLEALRMLADRTKVDDVRALVVTLVQTDKFGTSVGQALRTHADSARTKRRQRAEERAQKLGVKLVFPLVFCLFPAMYVVVLGPAALRMLRTLGPLLGR